MPRSGSKAKDVGSPYDSKKSSKSRRKSSAKASSKEVNADASQDSVPSTSGNMNSSVNTLDSNIVNNDVDLTSHSTNVNVTNVDNSIPTMTEFKSLQNSVAEMKQLLLDFAGNKSSNKNVEPSIENHLLNENSEHVNVDVNKGNDDSVNQFITNIANQSQVLTENNVRPTSVANNMVANEASTSQTLQDLDVPNLSATVNEAVNQQIQNLLGKADQTGTNNTFIEMSRAIDNKVSEKIKKI